MTQKKYRESLGEVWPFEFHQDADLALLANHATGNEEFVGELVYSALDELQYRGHSEDEVYRFVTWGDA